MSADMSEESTVLRTTALNETFFHIHAVDPVPLDFDTAEVVCENSRNRGNNCMSIGTLNALDCLLPSESDTDITKQKRHQSFRD
jgi:hypothetical protein